MWVFFFDFILALGWFGNLWNGYPLIVATISRTITLNSIVTDYHTLTTCPHFYTNLLMLNYSIHLYWSFHFWFLLAPNYTQYCYVYLVSFFHIHTYVFLNLIDYVNWIEKVLIYKYTIRYPQAYKNKTFFELSESETTS